MTLAKKLSKKHFQLMEKIHIKEEEIIVDLLHLVIIN